MMPQLNPAPCLTALSVFLLPTAAQAEVLWSADFETGDTSQISSFLNPKTGERDNIVVVQDPVYAGKYAVQVTIHPDDLWPNQHNRVELHQDFKTTGEGETTFMSWFFLLPENAKQHNDIGYWESDATYQQTMAFYVDPDAGGTKLGFRTNRPSGKEHWSGPVSINTWHQIAMQIQWSADAAKGKVSVWFDGQPVVTGAAAQTKADMNRMFIQLGYHRDAAKPDVESIIIDNAIEATSLSEVLPVPQNNGAGGAMNGASGGGGGTAGGSPGTGGASSGGQGTGAVSTGGNGSRVAPPASGGVSPTKPSPPVSTAQPGMGTTAPSTGGAPPGPGVSPAVTSPAPMSAAGAPAASPASNSGGDDSSSCRVSPRRSAGSWSWLSWGLVGLVFARRSRFGSSRKATGRGASD